MATPRQEILHRGALGLRPIRTGWVGPVVIAALVIVWTFCLWTYDRQVTNSWREDRDERLEMASMMLAETVTSAIQEDLVGAQRLLRTYQSESAVTNEVQRDLSVSGVAGRYRRFGRHRVLTRDPSGNWQVTAGDRSGRPTPLDPVLAQTALDQGLAVSVPERPADSRGVERAESIIWAGARDVPLGDVIVEVAWNLTHETLLENIASPQWPDLDQIVWGLRVRPDEDILVPLGRGIEDDRVLAAVEAEPWVSWQLFAEPMQSWYAEGASLRQTIWLIGGIAMALSVAFLLHIEFKNKILIGLANKSIETTALIETILDGSEDYSILAADLSGVIVRANRATEALYGHRRERLIGQPISILTHPQAAAHDRLDHILQVTLESERYEDVVVVRRADGGMVHVQLACAVRTDALGHPIGFVMITHDVTALLDRTVRLEQLNAQLVEQTRLAKRANQMVNEFLANMSHELRTPLNAILGYARLIRRKTEGMIPGRQTKNIDRIVDSGTSLLSLINDLLDLSKIESGRMPLQCESVDLPALVAEIVDTVRPLAASQRDHIAVDVAPDFPEMVSDPQHLRQIVMNLVANAIKFTSKGTVDVRMATGPSPDSVRLTVRDTGIGIPEEQLPHIFEAFYQVNGSTHAHSGTGLGLSIVRRLAERLGGQVRVDSRVGEGTTFVVTLPADVTRADQEAETGPQPLAPPG